MARARAEEGGVRSKFIKMRENDKNITAGKNIHPEGWKDPRVFTHEGRYRCGSQYTKFLNSSDKVH